MPTSSPFHEAARAWAQAGFFVFPCVENGKEPAVARGLYAATQDLEQIDRWWNENPRFNIGIAPSRSGMFVVDVDPPLGAETLAALEAENGALPATLVIGTPRGGLHYWFTGECPSTVQKLGPKLDTRGAGGYVLVPPSSVNGTEYSYASETDAISEGPSWIVSSLATRSTAVAAAATTDLDTPTAIVRATELLSGYAQSGHVAIENSGGDDLAYAVACEVLNLGLSPERAFDLMWEHWAPSCRPCTVGYTDEFIRQKIEHAGRYAQNDQGAWAIPPADQVFQHLLKHAENSDPNHRSRFYPYDLGETDAFAPPAWIIPDLIPEKGTVQIAGKHKSFKTFLTLDMALGIAAGVKTFGAVPVSRPVVYAVGENAHALVLNHVPAWQEAREVPGPIPFYVVAAVPRANAAEEADALVAAIGARGIAPAVLVIDTATRALRGLDENNAKDMGLFSAMCEFLQTKLNCTVIVIRHTGKDESRGGRGSNVIEGDFDTMLHVSRHEKSMAVSLRVQEQRNAAELELPFTFEGRKVGKSLVFFETDSATHRKATRGDDIFGAVQIGTALRALGAIGEAKGITTHVLAAHIAPKSQDDTPEQIGQTIGHAEKQLRALARGALLGYTGNTGQSLRWFLPELSE